MKRVIISALCMLVGVTYIQAEEVSDTTRVYVINGQAINHFDGQSLAGQTIKTYKVDYQRNAKGVTERHTIQTDNNIKEVGGKKGYVTGTVVDGKGEPIVGCAIVPVGKVKRAGTVTDMNGRFELPVSESADLMISYIGYEKQEVHALSGKVISVTLKEKGSDDSVADVIYVLDGKVITRSEMKKISPNTIKDMTVLKKGSKAALEYGPDGATYNIILINTKK